MPAQRRRIVKAMPKYLSLCKRGKNGLTTMFKAEGDSFVMQTLVKGDSMTEKGELLAVVYAPELRDSEGDVASREVIEDAMKFAAKNGGLKLDIHHDGKVLPPDAAYPVENFIIQKSDERFHGWPTYDGKKVDVTGAWGVRLQIEDPDLRKAYAEGEWDGVSMGGSMLVTADKSDPEDADANALVKFFKSLFKTGSDRMTSTNGDFDMDAKELGTILAESNKSLAENITKGVVSGVCVAMGKADPYATPAKGDTPTTAEKAEDDGKPTPPKNPRDIKQVRAYKAALDAYNARNEVDWDNPDEVEKYLAKMEPDQAELRKNAGVETGDSDQIVNLKIDNYISKTRLEKAMKSSSQSATDSTPSGTPASMDKAASDSAARMAGYINGGGPVRNGAGGGVTLVLPAGSVVQN